jgi:type VI secretion system protein VasD
MHIRVSLQLATLVCLWLAVALGCSWFGDNKEEIEIKLPEPPKPPKPPVIDATLEASIFLNLDESGNPSPLVVRTYELSDIAEFNAARFFSLYDEDSTLLGSALKAKNEMMLLPGEKKELKKELDPETRYFGVIGAYRDIDHAIWRAAVRTPPDKTTSVIIRFEKLKISIVPGVNR